MAGIALLLAAGSASALAFSPTPAVRPACAGHMLQACLQEPGTVHERAGRRQAAQTLLESCTLVTLTHLLSSCPAAAERDYTTMRAAKKSYAPRLTKAVVYYEDALRRAIDAKDWSAVSKAVQENGEAWNMAHVDTYTQGIVGGVVELKGPLKIFASSMTAGDSETIATQKLYAYASKFVEYNDKLRAAAEREDAGAALSAWQGGCVALRLYYEEINKNIPRSVGKWELPEPPFGRIEVKSLGLDEAALTGRRKKINGMQVNTWS